MALLRRTKLEDKELPEACMERDIRGKLGIKISFITLKNR